MKRLITIATSRGTASLAQAVSLVLLARGITPGEFGVASAFIGLCLFLIVLSDAGVSTVILRYARLVDQPDGRARAHLDSANATTLLLAAAAGVLVLGVGRAMGSVAVVLILCAAVWVSCERVFEAGFAGCVGFGMETQASLLLVSRRMTALLAQVCLLGAGRDGLTAFAWSLLAGSLAGALVLAGSGLTARIGVRRPFRYPLAESLQFWVASTSSQTRDLETAGVAWVAGEEQAGWHGVGYRLQRPVSLVAMSLAQIVLPDVSADPSSSRRVVRQIWLTSLGCLGATLLCLPLLPWLVTTLLGADYADSVPVAALGLVFGVGAAFCAPLGAVAQAVGLAREVARIGVVVAVLSLAATAAGAVVGGAIGAVVAGGCCYLVKYLWLSLRTRQRLIPAGREDAG